MVGRTIPYEEYEAKNFMTPFMIQTFRLVYPHKDRTFWIFQLKFNQSVKEKSNYSSQEKFWLLEKYKEVKTPKYDSIFSKVRW